MHAGEWDEWVQAYLHHRKYERGTRETYALALRNFAEWFTAAGVSPDQATASDIVAFRESLIAKRLSVNTVNTRFKNVRLFYAYLYRTDRITRDPVAHLKVKEQSRTERAVITLDELAMLWNTARGRERVIIGLLALCGLRRDELRRARVEDLQERNGVTVLGIPQRKSMNTLDFVAVPEILATEIRAFLNGRRTGLLISSRASGQVAHTTIHKFVRQLADRAGLSVPVTSMSLSFALRSLAMEHRFSYVSVVRTIPVGSPLTTNELIRNVVLPLEEHASIRLGRMLAARTSDDEEMLLRADLLLADRAQHPATAVMLASANLERVLREVTADVGLKVAKRDPSLSTYATLLKSCELLSINQLRTVERILTFRNDAAHGWFEKLDRRDAEWVLRESTRLVEELRNVPSASPPDVAPE